MRTAGFCFPAALLLSGLLAALPGCGGAPPGVFGSFIPDLHFELLSISSKTIPGGLEDDGDLKDVKLTDRASFKPSKGTTSGIAKRLRMKSSRDAGAACFVSERDTTGNVSSRVRVAVDALKGLVDGESLGFLERRPLPGGEEPVLRIEAVWKAGLDGFGIRYREDGVQVGADADLPGAHDVQLFLDDTGASLVARGAIATGEALTDFGGTVSFAAHAQTGGDETAVVAFGSAGLGKSGALYFDQFMLTCDEAVTSGTVESDMLEKLGSAWFYTDNAVDLLPGGVPFGPSLLSDTINAHTFVFQAEFALQQGLTDGTLHPTTDAAAVHKSFWNALAPLQEAQTIFNQDVLTAKDVTKAGKKVVKALDAVELAMAQIHGLKVKSRSKLDKTVAFTMD